MLTRNQENTVKILSFPREIVEGSSYEQPDTTDVPELESEESATQRNKQVTSGLEILTPDQMLSRLAFSLVQLNAGDNSEILKNKIRQILYSLYRSKKLTGIIYKSLIDTI